MATSICRVSSPVVRQEVYKKLQIVGPWGVHVQQHEPGLDGLFGRLLRKGGNVPRNNAGGRRQRFGRLQVFGREPQPACSFHPEFVRRRASTRPFPREART